MVIMVVQVIEEKTLGAEDTNINELRKLRDELTQQRDNLQLEVTLPLVGTSGVNPVLITNNLPKLGPDLVATLASLDMDNFSHGDTSLEKTFRRRILRLEVLG